MNPFALFAILAFVTILFLGVYVYSKDPKALLNRLSYYVVRDQQVHEVYGPDGQPMSSFWYTSEAPLTWNAGMIVYAFKVIESEIQTVF